MKPIRLQELVNQLHRIPEASICVDSVAEVLGSGDLAESCYRPFVQFQDDHYTRNLVHRSDLFDIIVLCWKPGQATPVHNHNGQCGWVRVLRGNIEEVSYRAPTPDGKLDPLCLDIDDDGVGHGVELNETGRIYVPAGPEVSAVDPDRAIHCLGNADKTPGGEPTITLHVYSRPHSSCLTFDLETKTCRRKELKYDSIEKALACES